MRILAIETSWATASVAALEAGTVLATRALDPAKRSARTLAPGMRELLSIVGWRPAQVELVAVAIGPGSFTGLRLGVMTAKAFAYAVGAQAIGIDTLSAIAARAPAGQATLDVAIDAQRGEVYCRRYGQTHSPGEERRPESDLAIVAIEKWLSELKLGTTVSGPALEKLFGRLPPGVFAAPRDAWHPDAATIGQLAARRHGQGARDDLWKLSPLYMRRSAAEEKAARP